MTEKFKNTFSLALATVLTAGFAGCTDNRGESEMSSEITTAASVNTEQLNEEDQQAVNNAADSLLADKELENKTIKWLAHYDLNPDGRGGSKSVALEMFESKYGGNIEYVPTTWENRWSDLSTHVLGGDGIDFFPAPLSRKKPK